MNMDLLSAGLRMMVLGMGMVYVFLIIMIFAMKLMSKALKPFANALQGEAKPAAKKSAGPSDEQLAAVAAAVVAHKLGK
ncbi:MAG: oxaloacetate decarboxylase [Lentisphaerae bacterium]|nr:oxaloacetate decarboxylase [Lentisphaerota bacterium]